MTFCSKQSAELAQQELHDKTVLPGVGVVCVVRGRRWMWGGGGNGGMGGEYEKWVRGF